MQHAVTIGASPDFTTSTASPSRQSRRSRDMRAPFLHRLNTSEVADYIHDRINQHEQQLLSENLESVTPDPNLAYPPCALSFKNVEYSILLKDKETGMKKRKTILEPCSGEYAAATMVSIMGPSGCGKSTLLDILADKKTTPYSGEVMLNGMPRDSLFQRVSAYVPQVDVMPAHWLVREAIEFSMVLRQQRSARMAKHKHAEVLAIAKSLGLETVMNTRIGNESIRGVSGGQRRRVTLARGLASGAGIMFCDEPTSGLSSTDAELCMKLLKILVKRQGITMFIVIHQPKPEVAAMFDSLLLLTSEPGRVVYNGRALDAAAHYAQVGYPVPSGVNAVDFFLDMVSPSYPKQKSSDFVAFYNAHCAAAIEAAVDEAAARPGLSAKEVMQRRAEALLFLGDTPDRSGAAFNATYAAQVSVVFRRGIVLMLRDKQALIVGYFVSIMKAVVVGIAFYNIGATDPVQQMPFLFMILQMGALSSMENMPRLIDQRTIMQFEKSDGLYSEWAYIITSFFLTLMTTLSQNALFFVIAFAMGGLDWKTQFGYFWLWQFLCTLTMDSMFQMIAAVAKSSEQAQKMALPFLMLFILFNGYFVKLSTVQPWMKWAIRISPMFYSIQEIAVHLFPHDPLICDLPPYPPGASTIFGFEQDQSVVALAVVLGEAFVFRVFQVVALKRLNKIER